MRLMRSCTCRHDQLEFVGQWVRKWRSFVRIWIYIGQESSWLMQHSTPSPPSLTVELNICHISLQSCLAKFREIIKYWSYYMPKSVGHLGLKFVILIWTICLQVIQIPDYSTLQKTSKYVWFIYLRFPHSFSDLSSQVRCLSLYFNRDIDVERALAQPKFVFDINVLVDRNSES